MCDTTGHLAGAAYLALQTGAELTVDNAHVPRFAVWGIPVATIPALGPPSAACEEPSYMENIAMLGCEVQRGVAKVNHLVEILSALLELLCGFRFRI